MRKFTFASGHASRVARNGGRDSGEQNIPVAGMAARLATFAHAAPCPAEISVVIPTFRRPYFLQRCLAALLRQDLDPRRFEIIVCDDEPRETTRTLVACYTAMAETRGLAVTYLPVKGHHGPAAARNRGWRAATGNVIAFTDDDAMPDPQWLLAGLAAMAAPDVAAASGRIEVPLPAAPTDYELDAAGLERAEFSTANCFVRRSMLEKVGGFDERYAAAWREDSDLQFSILSAGGLIVRADTARVVRPVRAARWGISLAETAKSRFDALLFKKHRELYRRRIAATAPRTYYVMVCSLAAAAIAASVGFTTAALY
ncbi:MAG TPA: glycosyltransferase, partial [Burkholderiales bacterium]|nr:glycosyltransferase [Burkholderiales bacterium]